VSKFLDVAKANIVTTAIFCMWNMVIKSIDSEKALKQHHLLPWQ